MKSEWWGNSSQKQRTWHCEKLFWMLVKMNKTICPGFKHRFNSWWLKLQKPILLWKRNVIALWTPPACSSWQSVTNQFGMGMSIISKDMINVSKTILQRCFKNLFQAFWKIQMERIKKLTEWFPLHSYKLQCIYCFAVSIQLLHSGHEKP